MNEQIMVDANSISAFIEHETQLKEQLAIVESERDKLIEKCKSLEYDKLVCEVALKGLIDFVCKINNKNPKDVFDEIMSVTTNKIVAEIANSQAERENSNE